MSWWYYKFDGVQDVSGSVGGIGVCFADAEADIGARDAFTGKVLLGGVQNIMQSQAQPVQGAAPIGSPSIIGNKSIIIEVTRPSPYIDGYYKAMIPPVSEEVQTIGSCKLDESDAATVNGYTPVVVKEVYFDDTEDISAAELDEIERLLKGGILL